MDAITQAEATPVLPAQALMRADMAANPQTDEEALDAFRILEKARTKKRRRRIIVGAVLGVAVLAALGWFIFSQAQAVQEAEDEFFIPTDYVIRGTFETSVSGSGSTQPNSQAQVTPEVEGIIAEVLVGEGDVVEAGQVVMTLKNDDLDKAITEADQQVRAAENGVESATMGVTAAYNAYDNAVAQRNAARNAEYATFEERDAAVSAAQQGINEAQAAINSAELEVENANLALTSAQDAAAAARATAEKRTVKSPVAGTVVACTAQVGQLVGGSAGTGSSGSLITVADLSQMRVSMQVNEVDINNLAVGQQAEVSFSALPDLVLPATVERIANISTGNAGDMGYDSYGGGIVTYAVDLVIPEPDPRVKSGMTARVSVISQRIEDALLVPEAALMFTGDDQATVMVATDEEAALNGDVAAFNEVTVKVLAHDGATAAVEGGVAEGDMVQLGGGMSDLGEFDDEMYDAYSMSVAVG